MGWLTTAVMADALGWAAAVLTLLTFVSGEMRRLRLLALAANAAFIGYGALAGLLPVLALHLALVPVNLWRLNQTLRGARHSHGPARVGPFRSPRGWRPAQRAPRARRARHGVPPNSEPAQRVAEKLPVHPSSGPATTAQLYPHRYPHGPGPGSQAAAEVTGSAVPMRS